MAWKFCDCCTADNACLIHSSMTSKGKPWPTYTLSSGTAPTDIENGWQFTADGTIVLGHDTRYSWNAISGAFDAAAGPHERKRLAFKVTLDSDTSSCKVTMFEGASVAKTSIEFRSWTPTLAKYPIVSAFYAFNWDESDTIGYDETKDAYWREVEEHIVDRWATGLMFDFNNGWFADQNDTETIDVYEWPGGRVDTYHRPGYKWDGNYAGNHLVLFRNAPWLIYDGSDPGDDEQITIEVTGAVTITQLELWHDPNLDDSVNGEICPGENTTALCECETLFEPLTGQPIIGTIPHELLLTWPEMIANPSYTGGSCANDCDTGAGGEYLLFRGTGTPGVGWECAYGTDLALTYGCVSTSDGVLYFSPYHSSTFTGYFDLVPWVDATSEGYSEIYGESLVVTEIDETNYPTNNLAAFLTSTGFCTMYNAAVVYDHIENCNAFYWKTQHAYGEGNTGVKCILPEGTNVGIRLPDSFTLDTV